MSTRIAPMLAVRDGAEALAFYQRAFGAVELWRIGEGAVAGLEIDGAPFFLADESPQYGTRAPDLAGHTTVRIELFVDEPHAVLQRAVEAGATLRSAIEEHRYPTAGPRPIRRMFQGAVVDPFGHMWLIGKILE